VPGHLQGVTFSQFDFDFRLLAYKWDARAYLQESYPAAQVSATTAAITAQLLRWLQRTERRFARAIDFGCGPVLHHAAVLAPYVDELHLADWYPVNLLEIQSWLDAAPQTHDWDAHFKFALECEARLKTDDGRQASIQSAVCAEVLEERKALLRERVRWRTGDLQQRYPLKLDEQYDLVASFFCAETAALSKEDWPRVMGNLCELLAPGGNLLLAVMRNVQRYTVGQKGFPCVCLSEKDLTEFFANDAFEPTQTEITVVELPEWTPAGYGSFSLVKVQKRKEQRK